MRRELIERTALQLFAERSIAEVSVRDLADAAGIGESGLYRHMVSKEELARRVFTRAYLDLTGRLETARAGRRGLRDELAALIEATLAAFDEDPVLMRFLLLRQHDALDTIDPQTRTPVVVVGETIDRAVAAGELAAGERELATATVLGLVLQPLTFVVYGRIDPPAAALAPTLTERVVAALTSPAETGR